MRPTNPSPKSNSAHLNTVNRMIPMHSGSLFLRVGAILILAGLLASSVYWSSAASTTRKAFINHPAAARDEITAPVAAAGLSGVASLGVGKYSSLFAFPQAAPTPTVATYASDCTTPKTVFNVQDTDLTVCAKVTGAPSYWRIIWSNANFVTVQNVPVGSGESTFTLTTSSSLGDWRVILYEPLGGTVQAVTSFTVIDEDNPSADLSVSKGLISGNVAAGAQAVFAIQVTNSGPSNANAVSLTDSVPANTTFVSFDQISGPVFSCSSSSSDSVCTIASLARGDTATFVATYEVGAVAGGTVISNTASISSTTADPNSDNNQSTSQSEVTPATCQLSTPENITVEATGSGAVVEYSTPGTSGDCGTETTGESGEIVPVVSCNPASGSFFQAGTTTVICASQTGTVVSFQVTVNNPGALSISLNGANPLTVECGAPFTDPGATAVNGTGQSVEVTVAGPAIDRDTPTGTYTLTYTATEDTNSVSTERTVIVSDTQAPQISIDGANPYRIQLGSCSPFTDPGVSATDDCGGSRPVTSSVSGPGGATSVDPAVAGSYTVTYTATDGTHEATDARKVLVGTFSEDEVDQPASSNQPPTITLNGDEQITIECGTSFNDPGATASVCGGPVPVTTTGSVDIHTPGIYSVTYSATANGHTTEATRVVTVNPDNSAPTITLNGANPMTVECHTSFTDPGAVAHDACAGDFPATASGTVNPDVVGSYTITYNATDPSGHAAAAVTRTVNVVDTTPPTVTPPANVTVNTGAGNLSCSTTVSDAALGSASATDSCQGSLATTRSGVPSGNVFPVGTTTITYSATDASNNTGTATQTVTVIDTTAPVITLNGANPITVECHTSFTDPGATAHDNCDPDFAATASGSVNVNVVGSYTITYNAVDAGGNNAVSVTRTVNVVDTTAPAITLNGQTLSMWPPNHKYKTFLVTDFVTGVSDSCDTPLGVSSVEISKVTSDETENGNGDGNTANDIVIAANCKSVQLRSERNGGGNGRVYTITFRVRDASGNTTTATAKVAVPHSNGGTAVDDGPNYTVTSGCP